MADIPTPEDVFKAPRIGFKQTVTLVIGPSLIALGLSIGSGEWLLAPLAIGLYGWVGIGFVALLSIILQAFYKRGDRALRHGDRRGAVDLSFW